MPNGVGEGHRGNLAFLSARSVLLAFSSSAAANNEEERQQQQQQREKMDSFI
jgi:hypothetical protein